ncbi:MAG TPA: glycosyltransferase family 4 protein [Bacteroidia bacterium]|jgi:glycosyltransferase involved in cell wall biosynthesis|nr:glycosyltransferase family 4 protein [Bacteroidia bacterium]
MAKKKVLLFSDWFYPGFMAGGPIQSSFNLINHLREYYDFSVITRDTDYTDTIPYKGIKSDTWTILPNGMRVFYFSAANLGYPAMDKLIQSEEFDIAYLNSMYSPRFTIMPLFILNKLKKKVILAPRGMLAPSAIAIKSWKKRPFLLWIKNSSLIKNMHFHAASEQEAGHIRNVFGKKVDIRMAPNLPGKMELPAFTAKRKDAGMVHLISVARVSPEKNLHYALEVLQKVKGKVKFDIFGPIYDYAYWEKCKAILNKLPDNIQAEHFGPIAKDEIPNALKDVHFLFMPTQGENFGHTILEAMMCGCPAIISDQTPWRGLEANKAGFDLPLNDQQKFVNAIEQTIAMDSNTFKEWSEGTRTTATNFINNPALLQQSIHIFE